MRVELVKGEKRESVTADSILAIAVANTESLLSPKVKLQLDRGYVKVDDNYESSVKGIYAAGDIIGLPWLAQSPPQACKPSTACLVMNRESS